LHNANLFKAEDLIQARESLNRVSLLKEQRMIVDNLVRVALKYIDIDELALRGFFLMAIQVWQKKRMIPIREIRTMIPAAREKYVSEMFDELERILQKILKDKSNIPLIKRAVEESRQHYIKHYASRPIPTQ